MVIAERKRAGRGNHIAVREDGGVLIRCTGRKRGVVITVRNRGVVITGGGEDWQGVVITGRNSGVVSGNHRVEESSGDHREED